MVNEEIIRLTIAVVKDTVGSASFNPSIEKQIVKTVMDQYVDPQRKLEEVDPTESFVAEMEDEDPEEYV